MKTEKYKLTREEIQSAFEVTGQLSKSPIKKVIIGILFFMCVVITIVNIVLDPRTIQNYVMGALVIVVLVFAIVFDKRGKTGMIDRAYKNVGNGTITEFIEQDGKKIHISLPDNDVEWDILPNECGSIYENETVICIYLNDKRIVVFPRRVLDESMTEFILNFKR